VLLAGADGHGREHLRRPRSLADFDGLLAAQRAAGAGGQVRLRNFGSAAGHERPDPPGLADSGEVLLRNIAERADHAMPRRHPFQVTELGIRAASGALRRGHLA
jgi:hypothetical protein